MTDGVATSSARTPSEPLLVALDVDGTLMSYDQEMSDDVCAQHIALYVNEYSLDIGAEGLKAIARLVDGR